MAEYVDQAKLVGGHKADEGKLRYDLVPVDGLRELVRVLTFGASKYAPYNWAKGMDYSRCYAAAHRHLNSYWEGEDNDKETGICHLAHALCCIFFLLCYHLRGMNAFDDRPGLDKAA